jgi:hypothetical protein
MNSIFDGRAYFFVFFETSRLSVRKWPHARRADLSCRIRCLARLGRGATWAARVRRLSARINSCANVIFRIVELDRHPLRWIQAWRKLMAGGPPCRGTSDSRRNFARCRLFDGGMGWARCAFLRGGRTGLHLGRDALPSHEEATDQPHERGRAEYTLIQTIRHHVRCPRELLAGRLRACVSVRMLDVASAG